MIVSFPRALAELKLKILIVVTIGIENITNDCGKPSYTLRRKCGKLSKVVKMTGKGERSTTMGTPRQAGMTSPVVFFVA
jgi:hypothetical protein